MKKILYSSIFCFLLIAICISNTSYAGTINEDITLLAIGIHYNGQPADTWVVKEVTNGPVFARREGQIQPPIELGIAGDLGTGTVDKIAFKIIDAEIGGSTGRGWFRVDADALDVPTPPIDAFNFLTLLGGSPISLESNSDKKFILRLSNDSDDSVIISDM